MVDRANAPCRSYYNRVFRTPWWRVMCPAPNRTGTENPGKRDTAHPAVSKHLEEALVNLLLTEFNHNHSDKLESPLDRLTPYFLKRAQEYIHANLEQTISISEIAVASGASVRSLQNAFKHYLNTTLTLYLRHQRLYKVRHALLSAAANGLSVTDIALAHGFTHLSKFSHYYKTLFGESPLQTKTGQR